MTEFENCLEPQGESQKMSLKLREDLATGRGSVVHYSPIVRDGFLRAMVTLLVTLWDFWGETGKSKDYN